MVCNPARWAWGLIPLALIVVLTSFGVRREIERDLVNRSAMALRSAGYYWALASFEGRNATLEGISFSGNDRDGALVTLRNVWGVRSVVDDVQLIATPETYTWLAIKKEKRIQLRGYVPTEEDRRTIIGFIKAALPDYEVDDKMVLAGGAPAREQWLGSVSYALVQLAQLETGYVRLDGLKFALEGTAATTEAYRKVNVGLAEQVPEGLKIERTSLEPPVVVPYEWRAKYVGSQISFEGFVPSESALEFILDRTHNLFPNVKIEHTLELASGAPESWVWAVSASLTQLSRLESGRIKIKDSVLEFEGVASSEITAKHVTASVRNSIPGSFRSSEKIEIEGKREPAAPKGN